MNDAPPTAGGVPSTVRSAAKNPLPQLDAYACCELPMARSDPIAEASLPAMRARSRPGIAIAAMMPMIATTISSSMSVKPLVSRMRMMCCLSYPRKSRSVRKGCR